MGAKNISRIIKAFYEGKTAKDKHDKTENYQLFYRNNKIAWIDKNWDLWISSCWYLTDTTKNRLNQLDEVHLVQRKYEWYLNGKHWDGSPIKIEK
jgi:hypothetical protein